MANAFRDIEWIVHSDLVTKYANRLMKVSNLEKLINSTELRFELLAASIKETLYPFGHVWVGREVSTAEPPTDKEHTELREALKVLSRSSRYLSLHLFDVLEHRRPAIISVVADGSADGERLEGTTLNTESYVEVQDLYVGLPAETPTLVKWIQYSLANESARHNLALRLGPNKEADLSDFWSQVKFPARYCQSVYAREPALKKCADGERAGLAPEEVAAAIHHAAVGWRESPFREELEEFATGMCAAINVNLSTENAALITLSFYLWECSIGIMPYYFRGIAWNLPHLEKAEEADAGMPAFLGVSCSSRKPLGGRELDILDALTRGIASAITICGIKLAQMVMSHAYIPSMLKHEVGNALTHLTNRLVQFNSSADARAPGDVEPFLKSLQAEIGYLHWLIREIVDTPDPDREPARVIYHEEEAMWVDLFSQMILRGKPAMDDVTLCVRAGGREERVELTRDNIGGLAKLKWPPPLAIDRNRMRQLLAILLANALGCRGVEKIEIRIVWDEALPGYVGVSIWDDGEAYSPEADPKQRVRYGHKLIERSMRALVRSYRHTAFELPPPGAVGADKVFRLTLPLSRVSAEE
jgi:hypothetical protein